MSSLVAWSGEGGWWRLRGEQGDKGLGGATGEECELGFGVDAGGGIMRGVGWWEVCFAKASRGVFVNLQFSLLLVGINFS
jgi:hypothetical protein